MFRFNAYGYSFLGITVTLIVHSLGLGNLSKKLMFYNFFVLKVSISMWSYTFTFILGRSAFPLLSFFCLSSLLYLIVSIGVGILLTRMSLNIFISFSGFLPQSCFPPCCPHSFLRYSFILKYVWQPGCIQREKKGRRICLRVSTKSQ